MNVNSFLILSALSLFASVMAIFSELQIKQLSAYRVLKLSSWFLIHKILILFNIVSLDRAVIISKTGSLAVFI